MKYKSCITEQDYKDKAAACLKGIEKIKQEINKCESEEKRMELAVKYAPDLEILERAYKEVRAMYDPDFEDCRDGK